MPLSQFRNSWRYRDMKFLLRYLILTTSILGTQGAWSITLNELIENTKAKNLDIKSLEAKLEQARKEVLGSTDISNPMISMSYMGTEGPYKSNGMKEKASYQISQNIPFPTKIITRIQAAKANLKATEFEESLQKQLIEGSARVAFWSYYKSYREVALIEDEIAALKRHLKQSQLGSTSNSLKSAHLLEIESQISLKENEALEAKLEVLRNQGALKILMALDPNSTISPPTLEANEDEISEPTLKSLDKSRALAAAEARLDEAQSQKELANSSYLPDFNITYKWNSEFANTPKSQEIMLGVEVPLFYWQNNAKIAQARAKVYEARAQLQKSQIENQNVTLILQEEINTLRTQYNNLKNQVLPKLARRIKLLHSLGSYDMESLGEHLSAVEMQLETEKKMLDIRVNYEEKLLNFQSLTANSSPKHSQENPQ